MTMEMVILIGLSGGVSNMNIKRNIFNLYEIVASLYNYYYVWNEDIKKDNFKIALQDLKDIINELESESE